jgi:hypothetical protein
MGFQHNKNKANKYKGLYHHLVTSGMTQSFNLSGVRVEGDIQKEHTNESGVRIIDRMKINSVSLIKIINPTGEQNK